MDTGKLRGNEIASDLVRFGARQLIVGPTPAVGISDEQIKDHFRPWEDGK